MKSTHDVRVWSVETYKGKRASTYRVRWIVAGVKFGRSFMTRALADSFRSRLVTAISNGESFDTASGRPLSMSREAIGTKPWLDLAREFMDARWSDWSPNHRRSTARSLMDITLAMLQTDAGRPDGRVLRKALLTMLNMAGRNEELPAHVTDALSWAKRNTRNVGDLADTEVLREVLQSLDRNLDGSPAAANTVRLRRLALQGAIEFAIERKVLASNPLTEVKTKKRKQTLKQVDPRSVVNPMQARMLIDAVGELGKQGPPLVAFFGCIYYAAMRPEEVCSLKKHNLSLPESGWGEIHLERSRPEVSDAWTDSGTASEERSLKHRDDGEIRTVPCPPALTEMLHTHLTRFGTARDGRLFRGARDGGRVGSTTYGRVWAKARQAVFTPDIAAGPLGKRPYDLRHAAVSTWLNGGVEPPRVAKWAGHSLAVLLNVYAKCIDGGEQAARDRVERTLRGW